MDQRRTQSDAALLARVQAGESECFAELVRRYQGALKRVARSRLGRDDWAEEAVQETLLAAFKSCATYDPRYQFRTWLWTILLNQCHAHYQRRARGGTVESLSNQAEEPSDGNDKRGVDSPLAQLVAAERTAQLEAVLRQLTAVQADALRLRFFGGLKFQEIADAMQCSLNTAKMRVRSGLIRMAQLLQNAAAAGTRPGDLDEEHEA